MSAGLSFVALAVHAEITLSPATITIESGQWQPRQMAFGRVYPFREMILSAPFSARIIDVVADVGDSVLYEQVLASFESPDLAAGLARVINAQQEVDLATRRDDALTESLREKAVTLSTKLEAGIAVGAARNRLAEAWQVLDNALLALGQNIDHVTLMQQLAKQPFAAVVRNLSVVHAPFSGLVVDRQIAAQQMLISSTVLFRLEDLSRVYVEVGVPQSQLQVWRAGAATAVVAGQPRALTLVSQEPSLDRETGQWLLRFVAQNPGHQLRDGIWLSVRLLGASRDAMWVPEAAVAARDGNTYCIRKQGDAFAAVEVVVGSSVDGRVPVLSGLRLGDQVVTEGAYEFLYRDVKELMKFVD